MTLFHRNEASLFSKLVLIFSTVLLWSQLGFSSVYALQYQYVGDPITRVFSVEEHQSGNQIWWVNQYIDGRMIFATGNGMSTWDGQNWQRASTPNNTRIRDVTIWHDKNIYAGAVGELGYFSPSDKGDFPFALIPTKHLLEDFGQTMGVNSNDEIVVFSTQQAVFVWDGKQIQKIAQITITGSRVFKIGDTLLIEDRKQLYSIDMVNGEPVATPLAWKFPPNMRIKSIFMNHQNKVVMVTNMQGVFELKDDVFLSVIAPEKLAVNYLNSGIQGQDGFYYLNSTIDGLMVFDETYTLMRHYKQTDGLGLSTIYNIFQDDQQNIWLAGLPNISVFQPPHIRSQYSNNTDTIDFENIFNIDQSMLFSGTGFYQLTFPNGAIRSPEFTQTPDFNLVVLDMLRSQDELFIGTEMGVYSLNWQEQYEQNQLTKPTLISSKRWVSEMILSPDEKVLYATIGIHLSQFDKINGQWQETRLFEDRSGMQYISIEVIDDIHYHIWFTTEQQELYRLSSINGKVDADSLLKFTNPSAPLGNDHLRPFVYDKRMLIGTQNGVIEYNENAKPIFTIVDDFPSSLTSPDKEVFKVEIDKKQRIWYHAGRDTGVAYKDEFLSFIEQEALFRPYNRSGTRGLAYFDNAIWFGVANGSIYRMSEEAIQNIPKAAPLEIRYINSINNDTHLPLDSPEYLISIDDNSIRIGFVLSDYSSPYQASYRTQLKGPVGQNWTNWSSETSKDFISLPGGDYTLFVESKDVWGRLSSTQYNFAVAYPWYASDWAKWIYLITLLLIIMASIRIGQKMRNKTLEQQNRNLSLGIAERTKELANKVEELKQQQILKDRFFSNVSHEFRTPLTLTIGPLETVLKEYGTKLDSQIKSLTFTALNNAKTMLALVGQVLDINRLELGKLSLRVSKHDMSELLRLNYDRFLPWAEQHQQKLVLLNCENPHEIYCDLDQIDKCISNLLSNAIKYSGKETLITMEIIQHAEQLGIRITDNGYGIHSSNKQKVFERFYQEEASNEELPQGTGIGLALVKELVDLHHGSIDLTTEIENGCQFTIRLQHGTSHFTSDQLIEKNALEQEETADTDSFERHHAKILVVDDNAELREFICQRLTNSFTVIEADNGKSALASAIKNLPDIIISDIAMPVMSGLELTANIKSHPSIKHIPILLLSAHAMKRDIVEGFASGADDYLIKPFDTSELVMRVNTLIKTHKALAQRKMQMSPELKVVAATNNSFEQDLHLHIFANLNNVDFSVDILSQLMFMSNETLRRKCQSSFDISPSAYIQQVRLQQAKLLLDENKMNISEVAYAVGFDSLSYFSKAFKKYYGVSPSVLNQIKKG